MTSANYCVIRDADTKGLYIGGDIDLDIPFTLSGTAIVGHQSVLSFMLKLKDPDDLKFKISIVDGKEVEHTVVSCTAQSNIWRAFQEVVDPNVLTPQNNKLRLLVVSGSGTLVLSDIVLMYQQS